MAKKHTVIGYFHMLIDRLDKPAILGSKGR